MWCPQLVLGAGTPIPHKRSVCFPWCDFGDRALPKHCSLFHLKRVPLCWWSCSQVTRKRWFHAVRWLEMSKPVDLSQREWGKHSLVWNELHCKISAYEEQRFISPSKSRWYYELYVVIWSFGGGVLVKKCCWGGTVSMMGSAFNPYPSRPFSEQCFYHTWKERGMPCVVVKSDALQVLGSRVIMSISPEQNVENQTPLPRFLYGQAHAASDVPLESCCDVISLVATGWWDVIGSETSIGSATLNRKSLPTWLRVLKICQRVGVGRTPISHEGGAWVKKSIKNNKT